MVHELLANVAAAFDDGLGVAHGLDGRGVACGVAFGDAGEEAMVDDTELAEGGGGVLFDAGMNESANGCEDAVDLRRGEGCVRLCAQVFEECSSVARVVARENMPLWQVRDEA